jgi:hypothetical protein
VTDVLEWPDCPLIVLSASSSAVAQNHIIGVASVVDGDAIQIHGQRIRRFGIDAPEKQPAPRSTDRRTLAMRATSKLCVGRSDQRGYREMRSGVPLICPVTRIQQPAKPEIIGAQRIKKDGKAGASSSGLFVKARLKFTLTRNQQQKSLMIYQNSFLRPRQTAS